MTSQRHGQVLSCGALLVSLAALAGCSSPDNAEPIATGPDAVSEAGEAFASNGGDPTISALFQDGEIDSSDYEFAFIAFSDCLAQHGISLENTAINPLDQQTYAYEVHYNGLAPDDGMQKSTSCFANHLDLVTLWYSETNPSRMSPQLRETVVSCVIDQGIDVPLETASLKELAGPDSGALERYETVADCASRAMAEKFPEIVSYAIPY